MIRYQVRGLTAWLLCGLLMPAWLGAQSLQQAMDEVPFITTPDHVTVAMLELAGVSAADHLIDLGSGDGRIVITAAKRFGASGLGVEIVPDLVARSMDAARLAGVAARTRFVVQDLFDTNLTPASVVTMYLLPEVNMALRPRLLSLAPGTRIVSHDWDLGDWVPDRTLTLQVPQKAVGREKISRLYLWTVPARVGGLWCSTAGAELRIEQTHQQVQASLSRGIERLSYSGRVHGQKLHLVSAAGAPWSAVTESDRLQETDLPLICPNASPQPVCRWIRAHGNTCG